ncbi:hypothetical protein [Caballeronia sp. NCTM5]|uniref:hypothetical protein n=1 Tax=Caballeronia sp. NCTM5 TaxID=2921755 RepID=UPI002028D45F|nr:hypothetical protein [Caballeronia sp. NCTM5]
MMRIEMVMLGRDDTTTLLDWFVHREEGKWFLTINEARDRIRSATLDVTADPIEHPAATVAKLWPLVSAQAFEFDCGGPVPLYLQAEIRVMSPAREFWHQASAWIWQDARVLAYRSHPSVISRAMCVADASVGELSQTCFDFAFVLEKNSGVKPH